MTRDEIILGALQLIGAKAADDTAASLVAAEQTLGASKLNALLANLSISVQPWSKHKAAMLVLSAGVNVVNLNSAVSAFEGALTAHFFPRVLAVNGMTATAAAGGALAAGTYYYRVNAYDGSGRLLAMGPETSAAAGVITNKTVNVAWTAVAGASYYRVFRGVLPDAAAVYFQTMGLSLADAGAVAWSVGSPTVEENDPLEVLSQARWNEIADKRRQGLAQGVYVSPENVLHVWPMPVVDGLLILRYRAAVSATAVAGDVPDLPARWGLALQYALAVELALPYVVPEQIVIYLSNVRDRLIREQAVYDAPALPAAFGVAD